jgi:predicted nucleic acid-binding protein
VGLIDDLKPGPVALDTQIFIYFIEEEDRFLTLVKPLFEAMDRGELVGVTSGLSLMEVLVVPYRSGNAALADRYEATIVNLIP